LASIEGQRGVTGEIEVVVADDGSTDETPAIVKRFRRRVNFPVRFVTHPHSGFCPGRCRNEGVAASTADYLLLLDGDCMIPPDHLRIQLARRRPGLANIGDCLRLSEAESSRIDEPAARAGGYVQLGEWQQRLTIRKKALKDTFYGLIGHRSKPHLFGNNVGMWRADYLRVNGFDENYVGWGCEDNDFGARLRRAGVKLRTILWRTCPYHLWHPVVDTFPERIRHGLNVPYFSRGFHLVRTGNGLSKRQPRDLQIQVVGALPERKTLAQIVPRWCNLQAAEAGQPSEVEVLFAPSSRRFSRKADCNLLVVPAGARATREQQASAHLIVAAEKSPQQPAAHQFALHQFDAALEYLLGHSSRKVERQSPVCVA
jgi:hypothetical protein